MSGIRAKSEIKLDNGITWTFVKGNSLSYVINILPGGEFEQLQASNKELLSALESIRNRDNVSATELQEIADNAITNAKGE